MDQQADVTVALATFVADRTLAASLLGPRILAAVRPGATLPAEAAAMAMALRCNAAMGVSLAAHPDASPALLTRLAARRLVSVDAVVLANVNTPLPVFLKVLSRKNRVSAISTLAALSRVTLAQLVARGLTLNYATAAEDIWLALLATAASPDDVAAMVQAHYQLGRGAPDAVLAAQGPVFLGRVAAKLTGHRLAELVRHDTLSPAALTVILAEVDARALPLTRVVVGSSATAGVFAASTAAHLLVDLALTGQREQVEAWMDESVLGALLANEGDRMYGKYTLWLMFGAATALAAPPPGPPDQTPRPGVSSQHLGLDAAVSGIVAAQGSPAELLAALLAPLGEWGFGVYAYGRLGVVPRGDVLYATALANSGYEESALRVVARVLHALLDAGQQPYVADLVDSLPRVVFHAAAEFGRWVASARGVAERSGVESNASAWAPAYLAGRVGARFGFDERAWQVLAALGPPLALSAASVTDILDAIEMTLVAP